MLDTFENPLVFWTKGFFFMPCFPEILFPGKNVI